MTYLIKKKILFWKIIIDLNFNQFITISYSLRRREKYILKKVIVSRNGQSLKTYISRRIKSRKSCEPRYPRQSISHQRLLWSSYLSFMLELSRISDREVNLVRKREMKGRGKFFDRIARPIDTSDLINSRLTCREIASALCTDLVTFLVRIF